MKFETKFKIQDYAGREINYLTVIGENEKLAKDGSIQWDFQCVCGNIITETPYRVISGHKKSCGCMRYKNIKHKKHVCTKSQRVDADSYIGKRNNRLTVVGWEKPENGGRINLVCRCDCGNTVKILPYQFVNGGVKSCGCIRGEKRKTHGLSKDPLYGEWVAMVRRCHNPSSYNYGRYGGRGIVVCDEWRSSPAAFFDWVKQTGGRPEGMTLDRIDNNGPYAPWNCRWATSETQQCNRRANITLTYKGETKCLSEWAKEIGVCHETLRGRYKAGWTPEEIIETPIGARNSGRFKKKDKTAP